MEFDIKCDVAVIGAGPVGLATACTLKVLNRDINISVFEKRVEATREHALRIQNDSIRALVRTLKSSPFKDQEQTALIELFQGWKGKSIPTTEIQDKLTKKAHDLGIRVFKGPEYAVEKDGFDRFVQETQAKVIIGTDGARSQVRQALKIQLASEFTLSYLLELKYKTDEVRPRKLLDASFQYIEAKGFDFETVGRRKEPGQPITVSLHKFIKEEIYLSLRNTEGEAEKGSYENPWTMQELKSLRNDDPNIQSIYHHFTRYFADHDFGEGDYFREKIIAFPLKIYRSETVAERHGQSIVLLAGDASSGMVLERGVNKGFIEASHCANAVNEFFKTRAFENMPSDDLLPHMFQNYQEKARSLIFNDILIAMIIVTHLSAGEFLLANTAKSIEHILSCHQSLHRPEPSLI